MIRQSSPRDENGRHSPEREPWRAFRSSLAVQFTSRRSGDWPAEHLSERDQAEIISALEARTSIVRSYSQIRSALLDFLEHAELLPPHPGRFGWTDREKFACAKRVLAADPSFLSQAPAIQELIGQVEELCGQLNRVVHGCVEVRQERSGDIAYLFKLDGKRQGLTCADLKAAALDLHFFFEELRRRLDVLSAALLIG